MRPKPQQGFTYLGLLFFVAITAAALAALGQSWSMAAQRERERELEFRGEEIARAIASYVKASPQQPGQYPARFEDLLEDRRNIKPRHHLRRLYTDPFTGKADWVLVSSGAAPANGQPSSAALTALSFSAVHSRSERLLQRSTQANGEALNRASDWLFSSKAFEGQAEGLLAPPEPPGAAASRPQ